MSPPNFKPNTLFLGDNLPVLRGMNCECVDLIYLDPPFNSKREYRAPIGSQAEGQMFDDTWKWDQLDVRWLGEIDRRNPALASVVEAARLTQGDGTAAYLAFMGVRLLELHRVLKPTGSLYLHCDPTANSYLRAALDAVFGAGNMRNEIVWHYGKWTNAAEKFQQNHDTLYFYGKAKKGAVFNKLDRDDVPAHIQRGYTTNTIKVADGSRATQLLVYDREKAAEQIASGKYERIVYRDNKGKVALPDVWPMPFLNSQAKERTGWSTQKPLALLQRVIKASSNPGDLVLDPFAGCATCLVAAAIESREWVGIEACEAVSDILQVRLSDAELPAADNPNPNRGMNFGGATIRETIPRRTDRNGDEPRKGSKPYKTRSNMDYLYGLQRGVCVGCKNHYRHKDFHFDHIEAQRRGGSNELDNLQLLCGHCNSTKGDGTMQDLWARLEEQAKAA